MSRYRKIEVQTWTDEKFRSLSPMLPCAQGLWFFLLTGPCTGPIPGLFRAGRAAMAEELGWDLEAFDKAFAELAEKGMVKADFKARLVWLPKAFRHNQPENPNVVKSWRSEVAMLPECALKSEAMAAITEQLKEIGEAFVKALLEVPVKAQKSATPKSQPNPLPNPFIKPLPEAPKGLQEVLPEGFGESGTGTGTGTGKNTARGAPAAGSLETEAELEPHEQANAVAGAVVFETGLAGLRVHEAIRLQAMVELREHPGEMSAIRDGMVAALKAYDACAKAGKLRFTQMGAERFIGEGKWKSPKLWGLKDGMKAYEGVAS